jgi:hypothetical protein
MAVAITQPQDDQFLVNGKLVYKDSNNQWIASEELTVAENAAFRKQLQAIQHNSRVSAG